MPRLGPGTRVHDGLRTPADGGRVRDGNRVGAFHNTSVTYIGVIGKGGPPSSEVG